MLIYLCTVMMRAARTLQFLQRQTKLASPRLPDCSFCSYMTTSDHNCDVSIQMSLTYKATDRDPIGMDLTTRRALHLEGVVERCVFCVDRLQVRHTAPGQARSSQWEHMISTLRDLP